MCGRFSLAVNREEMLEYLHDEYLIDELTEEALLPRYNVAPGQKILSVLHDGLKFRVGMLQWGFVPSFAKSEKDLSMMINAKAETIALKPAFRSSLEHKRCVILADGFYEWKKEESKKTPMRILVNDLPILPLAGIWSTFTRPDGTKLYTCAILTTSANELMSSIHDRMPVILTKANQAIWLDSGITNSETLSQALLPYDSAPMKAYEVSSLVNRATFDGPECISPV